MYVLHEGSCPALRIIHTPSFRPGWLIGICTCDGAAVLERLVEAANTLYVMADSPLWRQGTGDMEAQALDLLDATLQPFRKRGDAT